MRIIISLLFFSLTVACHAEKSTEQDCQFNSSNINLITPKADNIIHSYWQKDTDGYESVDRLYVSYKDGSIATIEHKYCSMYNFEIAYYTSNKSSVSNIENLTRTLETIFSFTGIKDDTINPALADIKEKLQTKKFTPAQTITIGADESNSDNQRVEYSISYMPIEDSSLHKAALFIYMGIGGEH